MIESGNAAAMLGLEGMAVLAVSERDSEIEVPPATSCASTSKSPTAATANSPRRTGGYAANSRAPSADSAPTPGDVRR